MMYPPPAVPRPVGYDGVLSIEHEDSLISGNDGYQQEVRFLQGLIIREKTGVAYWA